MTAYHDCPFCRCREAAEAAAAERHADAWYDPRYDDPRYDAYPLTAERRAADAARQTAAADAEWAARSEAGRAVCAMPTREGRRCLSSPIRGANVCNSHAPPWLREVRDYGRDLGAMACPADQVDARAVTSRDGAVLRAAWRDVVATEIRNALL